MKNFEKQLLLVALWLISTSVQGQVQCSFHGLESTLSKEVLANVQVLNFTGVEIHNALDARVYDAAGRTVYRYYVPKMINETGSREWSVVPGKQETFREILPFTNGRIVTDQLDLATYTGSLQLTLTLRHPLDTQSVVCRTKLTLPLSEGIIDFEEMTDPEARKSTGYYKSLSVEFPMPEGRFTPADLQNLNLVNTSEHTICDELQVSMRQQGRSWSTYELKLGNICVPPGSHRLTEKQLAAAVIEDRFDQRDTLRALQVQARLAGKGLTKGVEVSAKKHGTQVFPIKSHYNPALNLSVDFLLPQDPMQASLAPDQYTMLVNTEGENIKLQQPEISRYGGVDLYPATPYGDMFMSREAGGWLQYRVFRASDLIIEHTKDLRIGLPLDAKGNYVVDKHGPFEVAYFSTPPSDNVAETPNRTSFGCKVKYYDMVYLFMLSSMVYGDTAVSFSPASILNSIEINGHRLQFNFTDEANWSPSSVSVVPGEKTRTLPKEEYLTRLKTFVLYAMESEGKSEWEVSLSDEGGKARLENLLSLPYPKAQLDTIRFPMTKRKVVGENGRFQFRSYADSILDVSFGVPEGMPASEFSLIDNEAVNRKISTDEDGNVVGITHAGRKDLADEVNPQVTLKGIQKSFYGVFHKEKGLGDFSFSVERYTKENVPKQFYRALTLMHSQREKSIQKTMLHQYGKQTIYRSPLMEGVLHNGNNPGMSLLVVGEEYLFQFTVSGVNKGEILAWLNTIKVKGKFLKIASWGDFNYNISLE